MTDAVVWGSILTVVGALAIIGFLGFKVRQLMRKDAERHNE